MSSMFFVHLFHLLIVGSIFLYVGINANKTPEWLYSPLYYLGFIIVFYHLYKTYVKISKGQTTFVWVNLIHILLIGPLLIIIGNSGKETPRYLYEILLLFGFASIGYHGYYMTIHDHS